MVNTKDLIKIKEYDRFILFQHKNTGIKECIMKVDLVKITNERQKTVGKWERKENR